MFGMLKKTRVVACLVNFFGSELLVYCILLLYLSFITLVMPNFSAIRECVCWAAFNWVFSPALRSLIIFFSNYLCRAQLAKSKMANLYFQDFFYKSETSLRIV